MQLVAELVDLGGAGYGPEHDRNHSRWLAEGIGRPRARARVAYAAAAAGAGPASTSCLVTGSTR